VLIEAFLNVCLASAEEASPSPSGSGGSGKTLQPPVLRSASGDYRVGNSSSVGRKGECVTMIGEPVCDPAFIARITHCVFVCVCVCMCVRAMPVALPVCNDQPGPLIAVC